MTTIDRPMLRRIEEALARNPGKRRRRTTPSAASAASTRALRESGISEQDIAVLIEGHAHEAAYARSCLPALPESIDRALATLQETTGDGASADAAMIPGYGWTAHPTTAGSYVHAKAPGHKLMLDGTGWRHHLPSGQIAKRGSGQQSLTEYAKTVVDWGGSQNASEALDVVARIRARELGEAPRPNLETARLVEAIRSREIGRTVSASGEDLNAKMRALVTR